MSPQSSASSAKKEGTKHGLEIGICHVYGVGDERRTLMLELKARERMKIVKKKSVDVKMENKWESRYGCEVRVVWREVSRRIVCIWLWMFGKVGIAGVKKDVVGTCHRW